MKAFVTGGTGLLGWNLVDQLLEQGHSVKALVRSEERARLLPESGQLEIVVGNLEDVPAFGDDLEGCDVVLHCAGYHRECSASGDHREALRRINVDATVSLIEAAREHGVGNFVFVSSNGATGAPPNGSAQTESCPYDNQNDNAYFRSKVEAERAIDQVLARDPGMRVVVIRPAMMVGPNDAGPSPAGQVLRRLLRGEMPVVLPGNLVVVDARDVASAVLAAATRGVSGDRFIVGGRAVTFLELASTVEAAAGVPAPRRRPPYPVALAMLTLAAVAGRVSGHLAPVSPADLRRMRHLRAPDSSKAARVLGVEFRPLTETIRDTVAWLQADSASIEASGGGGSRLTRTPTR